MKSNFETIDEFILLKTLGTGYSGTVKLVRHITSKQLFAMKILNNKLPDQKILTMTENEAKMMKNLNHPNIIKFFGFNTQGVHNDKNGRVKKATYIVMELASKGEMFDVIKEVSALPEKLARYYFVQLLSALEYLHQNGIVHRDLKLENILLDENLSLKLADFGFSTNVQDGVKNKTFLGTKTYMAPELLSMKKYDAKKADIFSAGIILFILIAAKPPFNDAKKSSDIFFEMFVDEPIKFWQLHNRDNIFTPDLVSLLSQMLEQNPDKRISLEQIRTHKWVNQSIDQEDCFKRMKRIFNKMAQIIEQDDNLISNSSKGSKVTQITIGSDIDNQHFSEIKSCLPPSQIKKQNLNVEDFNKIEPARKSQHQIEKIEDDLFEVTKLEFEEIETKFDLKFKVPIKKIQDLIVESILTLNGKLIQKDNKKKICVEFEKLDHQNENIIIRIKFYEIEDGIICVDFIRKLGDFCTFHTLKKKIIENIRIEFQLNLVSNYKKYFIRFKYQIKLNFEQFNIGQKINKN